MRKLSLSRDSNRRAPLGGWKLSHESTERPERICRAYTSTGDRWPNSCHHWIIAGDRKDGEIIEGDERFNATPRRGKLQAPRRRKKPLVLAKLKPRSEHGDFLQFVLENLGRGSALNVRFRLEGDEEDFVKHEMMPLRGTAEPINFMSPGASETYELGAARTIFKRPLMKPFPVLIEYEDVDGQPYEKRIVLDVKQFDGLAWTRASVGWRQADALEKIAKNLDGN